MNRVGPDTQIESVCLIGCVVHLIRNGKLGLLAVLADMLVFCCLLLCVIEAKCETREILLSLKSKSMFTLSCLSLAWHGTNNEAANSEQLLCVCFAQTKPYLSYLPFVMHASPLMPACLSAPIPHSAICKQFAIASLSFVSVLLLDRPTLCTVLL